MSTSSDEAGRKILPVLACLFATSLFAAYLLVSNEYARSIGTAIALEVLSLLHETAEYVGEIYWSDVEYLWTSILLSVEVYLFTFILIHLVSNKTSTSNEPKEVGARYSRLVHFFTIFVRRFITFINDLRETYVYILLNKRESPMEVDLSYYYLLTCLTLGIVLSIAIVASYEYSQFLMWAIFLASLFAVFSSIAAMSELDELDRSLKEVIGISRRPTGEIVVKDGDVLLSVREGIVPLGLSIGTGIVGILTTLGAILMKPALIFTLVPATFDMVSLITALMEFTGLRKVLRVLGDFERLSMGLLNLLPAVSWSIYGGGIICVLFHKFKWVTSIDLILTFITSVWILIATLSGALSGYFKKSPKSIAKRVILSAVPLSLLVVR